MVYGRTGQGQGSTVRTGWIDREARTRPTDGRTDRPCMYGYEIDGGTRSRLKFEESIQCRSNIPWIQFSSSHFHVIMPTTRSRMSTRQRRGASGKRRKPLAATVTAVPAGETVACFAYGSNGTEQLRERCKNPSLVSHKAVIRDYRRFFTGHSSKWGGGGVASLAPLRGSVCKGSVVYLTEAELELLDRFEGIPEGSDPFVRDYAQNRYSRRWVEVDVWRKVSGSSASGDDGKFQEKVRAIAYVRNKTDWEGMPSTKYLDACYRNIAPFWREVDRYGKLLVYSYEDTGAPEFHLRGEFVGELTHSQSGIPVEKTFLGRMPTYDASHPVALNSSSSGADEHTFTETPDQHPHCPLFCSIAVYAVDQISPVEGSCQVLYRMYLWWEFKDARLASYLDRARREGGCTILSDSELTEVAAMTMLPEVDVYNKIEEPTVMDPPALRVFSPSLLGGDGDDSCSTGDLASDRIARGWFMWNAQYTCRIKGKFTLENFPFDTQKLKLDVKLLQVRYAKVFSLVVSTVQYHSNALDMSEWKLCQPIVKHRSRIYSSIEIVVSRVSEYYMYNVCALLAGLSALSGLAFTCEVRANGERLGVNMTLLLTAVAFKQLIAETLPKISYLTILDKWMLLCLFSLSASTVACVLPSFFDDDGATGLDAQRVNYMAAAGVVTTTVVFVPLYLLMARHRVAALTPVVAAHPKGHGYPWHVWDFMPGLWFLHGPSTNERL